MILITKDLFGIASRLKKINCRYRVFYNNRHGRFEVHTSALEFIVPYERLDCRTIEYALRTRKQNLDNLEREIESKNKKTEGEAVRNIASKQAILEDMLGYANRTGTLVNFTKNYIKEF